MWIFAYGSLVFRPGFSPVETRTCTLLGHVRRFYQGSTDHRGVPGAPGRVVTLVAEPGGACSGLAYRVRAEQIASVLAYLDHREQGGYERQAVVVDAQGSALDATTYIALPGNPNWLGPASTHQQLVTQIMNAKGPSGTNLDYVVGLAGQLAALGLHDAELVALAAALQAEPRPSP